MRAFYYFRGTAIEATAENPLVVWPFLRRPRKLIFGTPVFARDEYRSLHAYVTQILETPGDLTVRITYPFNDRPEGDFPEGGLPIQFETEEVKLRIEFMGKDELLGAVSRVFDLRAKGNGAPGLFKRDFRTVQESLRFETEEAQRRSRLFSSLVG